MLSAPTFSNDSNSASTKDLWDKVDEWLHQLTTHEQLKSECQGHIERTPETLRLLLALKRQHEAAVRARKHMQDTDHQLQSQYEAETKAYTTILERLGIPMEGLTHGVLTKVQLFAELGQTLGVKDYEQSSYQTAITHLKDSLRTLQRDVLAAEQRRDDVRRRKHNCNQQLRKIKRMLQYAQSLKPSEEQKIQEWSHNTRILAQKTSEYSQREDTLSCDYAGLQAESRRIDYASLEVTNSHIQQLKEQLATQSDKLASYRALPPDITLAQLRLEEANRHLFPRTTDLAAYGSNQHCGVAELKEERENLLGEIIHDMH
ncbi:hypothetical protein IWQ62_003438 [Dispira parvispora]|uniref:Uncharacterized protein n=1 Tax=Dispira parvispora TaxID=1520584 RepID=A0A9W8ANQ3_9FUNG|nr:hypothetical protein IWQ62_003438 [Dispira parvispora]